MDVGIFFQMAAEFFFKICSVKFEIFGYTFSVASVFIFSGLVVIVINFLHRLGD